MVDTGGLNYRINVKNEFSDDLDRFKKEAAAARIEWTALKRSLKGTVLSGDNAKNIRAVASSLDKLASVSTTRLRGTAKALGELKVQFKGTVVSKTTSKNLSLLSKALVGLSTVNATKLRAVAKAMGELKLSLSGGTPVSKSTLNNLTQLSTTLTTLAGSSGSATTAATAINAISAALARFTVAATAAGAAARGVRNILPPMASSANSAASRINRLNSSVAQTRTATVAATGPLASIRDRFRQLGESANRASFTFRRLFGILAAFAAARIAIQGFFGLIGATVDFNAKVEQAELGIAALLTQLSDVRDEAGNIQSVGQELESAFGTAREQVQLLRRDALTTAATFEELLFAFQTAVGPGIRAAFDVDQIRKFTLSISQAATAIGLEQNQLAEEIRSLLQGTISARTTRIATILGITSDDIKQAKEAGVLFEFLEGQLQGFNEAGDIAKRNFLPLLANLRGAFRLLLGTGGIDFFEDLKDVLGEVFELITDTDPITKIISPDPEAIKVISAITDSFKEAAKQVRIFAASFNAESVERVTRSFATLISTLTELIGGALQGVFQGFVDLSDVLLSVKILAGDLQTAFAPLVGTLNTISTAFGFSSFSVREFVRVFTRVATVIAGVLATLGAVKLALLPLTLALSLIITTATKVAGVINFVSSSMVALGISSRSAAAGVALEGAAAEAAAAQNALLGASLRRIGLVLLTVSAIVGALSVAFFALKKNFNEGLGDKALSSFEFLRVLLVSIRAELQLIVNDAKLSANVIATAIGTAADLMELAFIKIRQGLGNTVLSLVQAVSSIFGLVNSEAKKTAARARRDLDTLNTVEEGKFDAALASIAKRASDLSVLVSESKKAKEEIISNFDDSVGGIVDGVGEGVEGAKDFLASLLDIPPAISTITSSFGTVQGILKDINEEIDKLEIKDAAGGGGLGVGKASESLRAFNTTILETQRKVVTITNTLADIEEQRIAQLAKQNRAQRDILKLRETEQLVAKGLVFQITEQNEKLSDLKKLEARIGTTKRKQSLLGLEKDSEGAKALQEELDKLQASADSVQQETTRAARGLELSAASLGRTDVGKAALESIKGLVRANNELKSLQGQQDIALAARNEATEAGTRLATLQVTIAQRAVVLEAQRATLEGERTIELQRRSILAESLFGEARNELELGSKLLAVEAKRADLIKDRNEAVADQQSLVATLQLNGQEEAVNEALLTLSKIKAKFDIEIDGTKLEADILTATENAQKRIRAEQRTVTLFDLDTDNILGTLDNQLGKIANLVESRRISLIDADKEIQRLGEVQGRIEELEAARGQSEERNKRAQDAIRLSIKAIGLEEAERLRLSEKLEVLIGDQAVQAQKLALAIAAIKAESKAVTEEFSRQQGLKLFELSSESTLSGLDAELELVRQSIERQRITLLDENADIQTLGRIRGELLTLQEQQRQQALRQGIVQAKLGFAASEQGITDEERVARQKKITDLMVLQTLEGEALRLKIAEINAQLEDQVSKLSNTYSSFFKGVGEGFEKAFEVDTLQVEGAKIAEDIGNTFQKTISDGILSAVSGEDFDPAEAARGLFLRIADTAIQALTGSLFDNITKNMAKALEDGAASSGFGGILKAALSGLGGFLKNILSSAASGAGGVFKAVLGAFSFGGGAGAGLAKGGRISHDLAPGFAAGGRVNKKRRDPTDTIPIWTAPGEWVIKASSAARYGHDIMSRINAGLVDPSALRSIAGAPAIGRMVPSAPSPGPGFASGGRIGTESGAPSVQQSPSIAVIAPSEQSMERMLKGGKNAFLDFMQENSTSLKAMLRN